MAIEDNLCIVANERELPPIDAFSAALFWTAAKKRRRNEPLRKNHQFLGVCDQKLVELAGLEPASGKEAAMAATSVAFI